MHASLRKRTAIGPIAREYRSFVPLFMDPPCVLRNWQINF